MSLKDFQTVLTPVKETGALQFFHKPTKAILKAAFSRPDIGATSGANVFDSNGNLVELAENDPDWSFPVEGGCPKLLMRSQRENLSLPYPSSWGFATNLGLVEGPYPETQAAHFQVTTNPSSGQSDFRQSIAFVAGGQYRIVFFVNPIVAASQIQFRLEVLGGVNTAGTTVWDLVGSGVSAGNGFVTEMTNEDLGNGYKKMSCLFESQATETSIVDLQWQGTALTEEEWYFGGCQIIKDGSVDDNIFIQGTRSGNQFTLSDLIANGVFHNNSGAMLIEFDNPDGEIFQNLSSNETLFETNDGTSPYIRLRGNGGFYIQELGFSSGSSLVNINRASLKALLLTWDSSTLKVFDDENGGRLVGTLESESNEFTVPKIEFDGNPPSVIKRMCFCPVTLTDADALAALAEL